MLKNALKIQLHGYLQHLRHEIILESFLLEDEKSLSLHRLLDEIASLSPKIIHIENTEKNIRRPSFLIKRKGSDIKVGFAGLPLGHEFDSLVLALLQVGGHPAKLSEEQIEKIKAIKEKLNFETYFSVSCHTCSEVVQILNMMSILNPNISHIAVDGALFQQEVDSHKILSVPHVILNGETFSVGEITLERILKKITHTSYSEEAASKRISEKDPYDVLIVGAGPAGISAAIYAARKGLRTTIVSENFGGQVKDTIGIENFISMPEIVGPTLVQNMSQHLARYHVDILSQQTIKTVIPAKEEAGLHEVIFMSGASLKSKTIIAASGAKWRRLGVPGEEEYRGRGVSYCAHCDGPFFRGKHVVVVGGGNSGVEAANDLATYAEHVTLIYRGDSLTADILLQERLKKNVNLTFLPQAEIHEVFGNHHKMTSLMWKGRNGQEHRLEADGLFVQVGLDANTQWLQGVLSLASCGEVIIDQVGRTEIPGIFAAGDVTITPYKQIIVAMGEGAKAALAAFDYIVRLPS